MNIICLDTETTGLNHYDDEILQLSIIDGSGAILFSSRSGLSGGDAAKVEQAHKEGKLLGGDYLSAVTAEALKTAECNACMKRIVAAPTAGSCGPVLQRF